MRIKVFIAFLGCMGCCGLLSISGVQAQSAKQRSSTSSLDRQIEKKRQLIKELSKQEDQLSDEIKGMDGRIEIKESEVRAIEKQLSLTQTSLNKMEDERIRIEQSLGSYRNALAGRMRSVYMMGDMTYLDLLFSAGNFSDFVDRIFYVQTICGRDESLIELTQTDQAALAEKITQINTQVAEIERIRTAQRVQLGELTVLKRGKNEDLETIASNKKLAERQEREMVEQSKAIEQSYRGIIRSGKGYSRKWSGKFSAPCPGPIMSPFGTRVHPISRVRKMHTGVDIGAGYGVSVKAAGTGKVIQTGWFGGYGNCVIIDHGGGRSTLYGHLSRITCSSGSDIKQGVEVGKVGSTGYSTGPHLHFEVRINGTPVNPQTTPL